MVGNEGRKQLPMMVFGTEQLAPWKSVVSPLPMVVSVETVRSGTVSHPLRKKFLRDKMSIFWHIVHEM